AIHRRGAASLPRWTAKFWRGRFPRIRAGVRHSGQHRNRRGLVELAQRKELGAELDPGGESYQLSADSDRTVHWNCRANGAAPRESGRDGGRAAKTSRSDSGRRDHLVLGLNSAVRDSNFFCVRDELVASPGRDARAEPTNVLDAAAGS